MAELSNEDANELADEILLRSEFIGAREPGFFTRTVNRVVDAIGELITRFIGTLFGGAGGGAGSAAAFGLLGVAVVVILFALWRAWSTRRADRDESADRRGARVVFDEVVDAGRLRQDLARHRLAADWRAAVIAGFRLAVVELFEARVARERPGATTGDFGRDVDRARPDLSTEYRRAAAAFERAFYSDIPIDDGDLTDVQVLVDRLDAVGAAR